MTDTEAQLCGVPGGSDSEAPAPAAQAAPRPPAEGPLADCVLCGEPTEQPASQPGRTLCPVCAWQQAQRISCSG